LEHLFIINPKSFSQKADIKRFTTEVETYFKAKDNDNFFIHISRFPRDAIIVIKRHLMSVDPSTLVRVYAAGGAGVAFCCLNGIIGMPNAELALMPLGTGNDFVRAFGPEHYDDFRSIALQTAARAIPTDVIKCGGNYALNHCFVGMEASAVIHTVSLNERFEKLRRAFPPLNRIFLSLGGIEAAFDERVIAQKYEIIADGEDLSGEYNSINIANGRYYALGKISVPQAVPNDGFLDMLITKKASPLGTIAAASYYLRGLGEKFPGNSIYRRVKKITIRSGTPLFVNIDDELFFDTHLEVEIIPHAVSIVAVRALQYVKNEE
jgi:diacylglycerol kinase family enzyme